MALLLESPWKPTVQIEADGSTKIIPNKVVVSVLGFKFQYYQLPEVRSSVPLQLIWIAAIMIKHSIIDLEQLYPHLSPLDKELQVGGVVYQDHEKNLKRQAGLAGASVCASQSS